jgi:GTP-binding protein HflX
VVTVARAKDRSNEAQLAEIVSLVEAQGDRVAGSEILVLRKIDPRTLLGKGACSDVARRASDCGADMLVFDAELSPSQMRNLEDATGFSVADREGIILNVFLRHAKTRSSRIQVEIAQLEYLRPRIRGLGLDMDQQTSGAGPGRGPGETASELKARQLDRRLGELKKAFEKVRQTGDMQRKQRASCKRITLVGYTNAGKTSLMNALASTDLSARDVPFETLDTTSRALTRHGRQVLLSDTVGFIRRLPERLLASFESTLSEIRESSLLAVVVDVSDPERHLHVETTEAVLAKLGADQIQRLYVFNKADRAEHLNEPLLRALTRGAPLKVVSSHDPIAVAELKETMLAMIGGESRTIFVPYAATDLVAMIYGKCRVLKSEPSDDGIHFTLEAEPHVLDQIERNSHDSR